MSEYIEREAAVNATLKLVPKVDDDGCCWVIRGDVARAIDSIPAADARPVVRGYWHGEGDGYADGELVCDMWQCSCCGEWFDEWDDKPTWNYCPNCGAKMDADGEKRADNG